MADLLDRRLVFVTGKGGVGKTTVAASLAMLAAERGKKVLACEIDAKGDLADAFATGPTSFRAREVHPNLWAMSMDPEESLQEYIRLNLRLPFSARIGPLSRVFDFVANAAPGVREIVTVGKLTYEVRERHYDLVIVDAPPTGHIVGHLAAPEAINELVAVGVVRDQTGWMSEILSDPSQTGLVIVSTPEEMPVNETIELSARVTKETSVDLAAVVVNRVLPELFGRGEEEVFDRLDEPAGVGALQKAAGKKADALIEAAHLAVRLRRTRAAHLQTLRESLERRIPFLLVPELFSRATGLRTTRLVAEALSDELSY